MPEEFKNHLTNKGYLLFAGGYFRESTAVGWIFYPIGTSVTHWLDLSKLTTKEKAIKLAEEAYKQNYEDQNTMGCFEDFLNDKIGEL